MIETQNIISEICVISFPIYKYSILPKLNKNLQEPNWPFVSFWNLKSLSFTCSYSLSFVESLSINYCHSLSFVVIVCNSLYHLLSLDVTFISLFINDLPMLWCECFSQVFIIEIKKDFFHLTFWKYFNCCLYFSLTFDHFPCKP